MNSNENYFYPSYILGKRRPDRFTEMSNNDCSIMAFQEYYDRIYINGKNVLRIHILVPTKRTALVICLIYNTYIVVGMATWCSVNIKHFSSLTWTEITSRSVKWWFLKWFNTWICVSECLRILINIFNNKSMSIYCQPTIQPMSLTVFSTVTTTNGASMQELIMQRLEHELYKTWYWWNWDLNTCIYITT